MPGSKAINTNFHEGRGSTFANDERPCCESIPDRGMSVTCSCLQRVSQSTRHKGILDRLDYMPWSVKQLCHFCITEMHAAVSLPLAPCPCTCTRTLFLNEKSVKRTNYTTISLSSPPTPPCLSSQPGYYCTAVRAVIVRVLLRKSPGHVLPRT